MLVVFGLAACATPEDFPRQMDSSATPSTENRPSLSIRYKAVKCPTVDVPLELDCGYLVVPADHTDPSRGKIRLSVMIVRAAGREKSSDPVLFLSGGPGVSAAADLGKWVNQPFLKNRDLILVDQRGVGRSEPNLNCPEMEDERYPDPVDAARACRQRLIDRDLDLSLFNSSQSTADMNALRQVLGYDEWNVLGVSYGTRLALMMLRDYPQGIRSVILDSAYPPEVNAYETRVTNAEIALNRLFQDCLQNPTCNYTYPDLKSIFDDLLNVLDQEPVQVVVDNPSNGETTSIYLDGRRMAKLVFEAMYRSETLERIPYVIYEVLYGNYEAIAGLLFPRTQALYYPSPSPRMEESEGAYYSVECREEVGFNRLATAKEAVQQSGSAFSRHLLPSVETIFDICNLWKNGKAAELENEAVLSTVPAMVMAGQFDPVTPPEWSQQVARNLTNSYAFIFPGEGHSVLETGACPQYMTAEFLKDPTHQPAAECIGQMGINFWMP